MLHPFFPCRTALTFQGYYAASPDQVKNVDFFAFGWSSPTFAHLGPCLVVWQLKRLLAESGDDDTV